MNTKAQVSQLELFSQGPQQGEAKTGFSGAFLNYLRNYEKALIGVICFIITGIVFFSLGVEKGKKLSMPLNTHMDMAVNRVVVPAIAPVCEKANLPVPAQVSVKQQKINTAFQGYTIQLATLQNKVYAQKTVDALKKKGFNALLLPKGKFLIVCVGNFSDKQKALSMLPKLRESYPDCCIRRL